VRKKQQSPWTALYEGRKCNRPFFCNRDTKGGHLLSAAVARKLFDIKEDGKTKLQVRFISEGKQTELRGKAIKGGFTVWKMKNGTPTPIYVGDMAAAVAECLK
jgi:type III restriction enzyme